MARGPVRRGAAGTLKGPPGQTATTLPRRLPRTWVPRANYRGNRRMGGHDVPQVLHLHIAGQDRCTVAPAVGERQARARRDSDGVEPHVVHRRFERGRTVERAVHPPDHLVEQIAVRCDGLRHPLGHLWVGFDLFIDADQLMSHVDDLATFHHEVQPADKRAVAARLDDRPAAHPDRAVEPVVGCDSTTTRSTLSTLRSLSMWPGSSVLPSVKRTPSEKLGGMPLSPLSSASTSPGCSARTRSKIRAMRLCAVANPVKFGEPADGPVFSAARRCRPGRTPARPGASARCPCCPSTPAPGSLAGRRLTSGPRSPPAEQPKRQE